MSKQKQLYLYDSRYNIKTPTTARDLASMGILNEKALYSYKSRRKKINKINKYIIDDNFTQSEIKDLYCKEVYQDETWADVEGYDYKYKVSNYGRVKRIGKTKDIMLLPFKKNKLEYMCVKLKKDNRFIQVKVYKLVAKYFLDNINNETHVVHINGIKHDDRVCNLEYISKKQLGKMFGSDSNSSAVYKVDIDTFDILDTYKSGREAGRIDKICYQSIFDVVNKKTRLTINKLAYVSESDYEAFMEVIDTKEFLLFDAVTYEKNIGTIEELNNICNLGIYNLKYMYDTGKCINANNIYLFDKNCDKDMLNNLYKNSCGPRELWREIDFKDYNDFYISDYGRVKKKDNILLPIISNNTKYIKLTNKYSKTKNFEVFKLVSLYFKKTTFKNKTVTYDDLDNYKVLYADNNFYNTKSTNIEIFQKSLVNSIDHKEREKKVFLASKKKKLIKKTYENIYEVASVHNINIDYLHLCIKDFRRISNNLYMFEHDCKNFNYEVSCCK